MTSATRHTVAGSTGATAAAAPSVLAAVVAPLTASGLCFIAYPALRPFSDEQSLRGAAAFASDRWIAAHTLGIAAFLLLAVGLLGVYELLTQHRPARLARAGLLLSWTGVGLTLPYYGAEVFGLHAAGQRALASSDAPAFDALIHDIRWEAGIWFIITGLLLLAAGVIALAVAAAHSVVLPRWSAMPLAVMISLYIPQFAASHGVRVGYGVLLAAACGWLAWTAYRSSTRTGTS